MTVYRYKHNFRRFCSAIDYKSPMNVYPVSIKKQAGVETRRGGNKIDERLSYVFRLIYGLQ